MGKYTFEQLVDSVDMVSEINCSNCPKTNSYFGDDYSAAEDFFRAGWRATRSGNVYCPDCASKKLKHQEH